MSAFEEILNEPDEMEETPVESTSSTDTEPVAEAVVESAPVAAVDVPEGEAAAAEAPAPITREDGATWSEKSQRWHKDGKIVAGEPPVVESKVEQAATPATPVVAPVTPEPAPVTPPAEFTFRANGQKVSIPGLVVPPEQQEYVRNLLVAGMNHHQNFPRMQAEWKQKLQAAEQMAEAKSSKYNKASVFLWDKLATVLQDAPAELQMLQREVALMLKEADLALPRAGAPAQPEVNEQQIEQAARHTLSSYVNELFEDTPDAAKYFTAEDRRELAAAMDQLLTAYFEQVDGEIMLDTEKVKAHFTRELNLLKRSHQARENAAREAKAAKEAAAFNRGQQPTAAQTPVKTVTPKPVATTAPSGKPKGWDQSFKSAWDEDDEE